MSGVPVLVLSGFLGSGKTTLLNHLLTASGRTRVGVVVNDFGQVNIDALAVAGQVDSMVSLGNGCLCCAVDTADLDDMLGRLARPGGPVDVIVIEASGLAEPPAMVRMVLGSDNPVVSYGGLVMVVDAVEYAANPRLERHLPLADLVVVNKVDRADPAPVRELVERLAPGRPVVETSYGRVDPALLFDVVTADDSPRQLTLDDLREDCDAHLHAGYAQVTFTTDEPLHPGRLMDFLDARPPGLFRVKGPVRFGREGFVLQAVGNYLRFHRSRDVLGTALVVIGSEMDTHAVSATLDACRVVPGEEISEADLARATRFVAEQTSRLAGDPVTVVDTDPPDMVDETEPVDPAEPVDPTERPG